MSVSEMDLSLYRIEASGAPATCVPRMLSLPTSPTSLLDLDLHVEAFSRAGMHPALPLVEFPDNTHCSLVAGGLKLFMNILKLFILFITTFSLWFLPLTPEVNYLDSIWVFTTSNWGPRQGGQMSHVKFKKRLCSMSLFFQFPCHFKMV